MRIEDGDGGQGGRIWGWSEGVETSFMGRCWRVRELGERFEGGRRGNGWGIGEGRFERKGIDGGGSERRRRGDENGKSERDNGRYLRRPHDV